jgi:hypothetical protein
MRSTTYALNSRNAHRNDASCVGGCVVYSQPLVCCGRFKHGFRDPQPDCLQVLRRISVAAAVRARGGGLGSPKSGFSVVRSEPEVKPKVSVAALRSKSVMLWVGFSQFIRCCDYNRQLLRTDGGRRAGCRSHRAALPRAGQVLRQWPHRGSREPNHSGEPKSACWASGERSPMSPRTWLNSATARAGPAASEQIRSGIESPRAWPPAEWMSAG